MTILLAVQYRHSFAGKGFSTQRCRPMLAYQLTISCSSSAMLKNAGGAFLGSIPLEGAAVEESPQAQGGPAPSLRQWDLQAYAGQSAPTAPSRS